MVVESLAVGLVVEREIDVIDLLVYVELVDLASCVLEVLEPAEKGGIVMVGLLAPSVVLGRWA